MLRLSAESVAPAAPGRQHLAYKAEHVVDLDSDLILAAVMKKPSIDNFSGLWILYQT